MSEHTHCWTTIDREHRVTPTCVETRSSDLPWARSVPLSGSPSGALHTLGAGLAEGRSGMANRTYRHRLLPTAHQSDALDMQLRRHRELYNAALEQRIEAFRRGKRIGLYDQMAQIGELRTKGLAAPAPERCEVA